jgi:hypothetical protein
LRFVQLVNSVPVFISWDRWLLDSLRRAGYSQMDQNSGLGAKR